MKYPDMKGSFDNLTQNPDGSKKWDSKSEFQNSSEYWDGYMQIMDHKGLTALIKQGIKGETGIESVEEMDTFVDQVKQNLLKRYENNFNPTLANGSLFGWLVGGSGKYNQSILYRAKGDVMNEYKKQIRTQSMDQESRQLSQREAEGDKSLDIFENQDITKEKAKKNKGIILYEKLGKVALNINEQIKSIAAGLSVSNLNFKKLQDLVPELTQEMFGIVPKTGNLTKQDIKNAQMFINKHAEVLLAMLPKGSTADGTSTGVQKVLLDAFYTKTDRAKMAKTGSGAGLAVQVKNANIKIGEFLEIFGITERGKPNLYRKDTNTSSRIKALVAQTGRMITNQAVREHLTERQESLNTIQKIADGKSDIMFSLPVKKNFSFAQEIINNPNIKSEFYLEYKGIDDVLKAFELGKTIDISTEKGRKDFIDALKTRLFPMLPREFFFNYNKDGKVTSSIFTGSAKNYRISSKSQVWQDFKTDIFKLGEDAKITFGENIKGADWSLTKNYATIFGDKTNYLSKIKKGIKDGSIKKWNDNVALIHKEMWVRFKDAIRTSPDQAQVIGTYLKLVGNDTSHWHTSLQAKTTFSYCSTSLA